VKRIKTMGIAVVMALALTAFAGAGTASADKFKVAVEPATWTGSLTGANHSLALEGEWFSCKNVAFSGETVIKTLDQVTVSPELGGCAHITSTVSWTMNGCKFRFRPGPGAALPGSLDIVGCEKPMSNTYFSCVTEIGNQSGLGPVTYKNIATSPATITAVAKIDSLTFTRSGTGCNGPKGTFHTGTYTGEWTLKGSTKPGGVQAAVEVEATGAPSFKRFVAEEAPATLSGSNANVANKMVFNFTENGAISCESVAFSGTASVVWNEAIAVAPTFHECSVSIGGGAPTKIPDEYITAGGCSYELNAKGGFAIVGAGCAGSPMTITIPGCILTVGPQSGFVGPTFKNLGSGKLRTVQVVNNPSTGGLTYNASGAGCVKQGTIVGASPKIAHTLSAVNSGGAPQGFSIE
jgi:hypothetical protein